MSKAKRKILKELLAKCSLENHLIFKRMYSHTNLELPIDEVVDKMPSKKLDHAINQAESTLKTKSKKVLKDLEEFYNEYEQ